MQQRGVDVLLVQSTDPYLNEYVPTEESARVWISGFTGSMGDVVIAADRAYLIVDGRYWIQADRETDPELFEVIRVTHGTGIDDAVYGVVRSIADASSSKKLRVGYERARITPHGVERLESSVGDDVTFKPLFPSPVEIARGDQRPIPPPAGLRTVDERRVGLSVADKRSLLAAWLEEHDLDALLVQRLDAIAYLTNLRGTGLPYQATFKSVALVTRDGLTLGIDPDQVPDDVRRARADVAFVHEDQLWRSIGKQADIRRVGYDPDHNTAHARTMIEDREAVPVAVSSPVGSMKATKTRAEMKSMKDAFRRADQVVATVIRWANAEIEAGNRVTETAFADRVHQTFVAHGAVGLSFKIISAAGRNGAIIHYSDPSPRRALKAGELMLLDTGAYFDEGYATDLTRTFLVGGAKTKATEQQRRYFTLVLKAAIAGMRAVFPVGTRGAALDALVRAPLWAHGLDYAHGTGHGVGINVHEAPASDSPPGADTCIEPGHVFSIEPGLYMPGFGGVRIENLCTVEPAPKRKGFLQVVPLTFCPLDRRLIEAKLLTADEKSWLRAWSDKYEPARIDVPPAASRTPRGRARPGKGNRARAARRPDDRPRGQHRSR